MSSHRTPARAKQPTEATRQLFSSPPFKKVMSAMKSRGKTLPDRATVCKALCRCVINAVTDAGKEDPDVLDNLKDIVQADGVSPNPADDDIGPLYLASKLNLPKCAGLLLQHGASIVAKSDGETPIEVAIRLRNKEVLKVLFGHITMLENGADDVVVAGDIDASNDSDVDEDADEDDGPPTLERRWTHTTRGHTRSHDVVEKRIHRVDSASGRRRKRRKRGGSRK